jgi:hypothetical protein
MEKIELDRVSKIQGVLSGKISNVELDPGLEPTVPKKPGKWLYYFNQKYLFVADYVSTQKTDSEAGKLLKDYPTVEEMKVTACFLSGAEQVLPDILKKHPDVKILTVSDSSVLANYIYLETLVTIDPKTIDKFNHLTLGKRVMDFLADRKKTDEIVTRLRANMRKNIR